MAGQKNAEACWGWMPCPPQKETNVPQQKCIVVLDPFPALTLAAWCEDCDRLQRQQGSQQVEPQTLSFSALMKPFCSIILKRLFSLLDLDSSVLFADILLHK